MLWTSFVGCSRPDPRPGRDMTWTDPRIGGWPRDPWTPRSILLRGRYFWFRPKPWAQLVALVLMRQHTVASVTWLPTVWRAIGSSTSEMNILVNYISVVSRLSNFKWTRDTNWGWKSTNKALLRIPKVSLKIENNLNFSENILLKWASVKSPGLKN